MIFVQLFEDPGQQPPLELNDVFRAIDESHFKVEGVILRQMAARGMRLCAIDMSGLKHAFESSHSMLFIELRTLRQVCHAVEILNGEEIGTALGAAGDNLGRHDFCEAILRKVFTKVPVSYTHLRAHET